MGTSVLPLGSPVLWRGAGVEGDGDEDDEEVDEEEEDEPEEEEEEDDDENALAGLSAEEYKLEEVDKLRDERMQLVEQKESVLEQIT